MIELSAAGRAGTPDEVEGGCGPGLESFLTICSQFPHLPDEIAELPG
jgi:hypothetical protein